jgi:hypothetical protein
MIKGLLRFVDDDRDVIPYNNNILSLSFSTLYSFSGLLAPILSWARRC